MVAITPEQFEFVSDWEPVNDATRKLIRTGGWREINASSSVKRQYMGIITLGNIDATNKTTGDKAYYAFETDASSSATLTKLLPADSGSTEQIDAWTPANKENGTDGAFTAPTAGLYMGTLNFSSSIPPSLVEISLNVGDNNAYTFYGDGATTIPVINITGYVGAGEDIFAQVFNGTGGNYVAFGYVHFVRLYDAS